jgi:flagellar hook assembly protein FlgD
MDAQKIKKWGIGSGGVVNAPSDNGSKMSGVLGQLVIGKQGKGALVGYYGFWTPSTITDVNEPVSFSQDLKNYPNPFSASTKIEFQLPTTSFVTIKVYDMVGNVVRTLITGALKDAGTSTIEMDARDESGLDLASGTYIYEVTARSAQLAGGSSSETKVMRNIMVVVK